MVRLAMLVLLVSTFLARWDGADPHGTMRASRLNPMRHAVLLLILAW